jgi:tripartite ATP-independent transporter DctM subunit
MAGGALGALIPPSIPMILFAHITTLSVGRMFAGGVIPGLILALLYITYIALRCLRNPELGPAVPPEERVGWREKFIALRGSILPFVLILGVLGSIFSGAATPTEAAAVGVGGALICAAVNRKLDWPMIRIASYDTLRLSGMVMWILIGAAVFTRFYMGMGAAHLVEEMVMASELSPWAVLIMMQLSLMALGMIMDDYAVVLIAAPIYTPIIVALGFNPLWFGILFLVNLQIAYLTPPYGFALFYMKGVVSDRGIPMSEVWHAILPFIPLQIIGLALVMIFPQLALFLPGVILK